MLSQGRRLPSQRIVTMMRIHLGSFLLMLVVTTAWSTEPILIRLSFRVTPERMSEFETVYQEKVVPILTKHGLVQSSTRGRETPDSVFARLLELGNVPDFVERRKGIFADTVWKQVLRDLGTTFGTSQKNGQASYRLRLYGTSGEPANVVPAGRGRGFWRTYGTTDGLSGTTVHSILQDRDLSLWFGTSSGASRYDGQAFTTITTENGLPDNTVSAILRDRSGNLWFATKSGAIRYDGKSFVTFTQEGGFADRRVTAIVQDREGYLWFGTNGGGVSRFDGESFTKFTAKDGLAANWVFSILQDQEGYLWFGTWGGGVSRYDGKTFTNFGPGKGLLSIRVPSIFQDREGYLWFGTDRGVSRYDGKSFTNFTPEDGLVSGWIGSIFQDREGYLWFGSGIGWSEGGGVSRYDGETFTTFTTEDGLASNSVYSISQDQEGHLWFGTGGMGASRYGDETFTTFTEQDGLAHNMVIPVFQDREGYLWFGTQDGVSRYDGQSFATFSVERSVSRILQDREGNLWFGTSGDGIIQYDGKRFVWLNQVDGLRNNWIYAMQQAQDGDVWIGTYDGLHRYDGHTVTAFTTEDGLARNGVWSILQDREGYLWFGTSGGASRYDGENFTNFTTEDGLVHNGVNSILQDQEGRLWFGTVGGVSRFDGERWTSLTTRDGLANNLVYFIFQDRDGCLWFATDGGVSRYDGEVFQTLTDSDGLGGNSVKWISQDRKGCLWFTTSGNGVTRYRMPLPSPPTVSIDAVTANRRYEGRNELAVSSSVRLVSLEFHGASFKTRPEAMIYRYRLQGHDKDWGTTHARRVEYQDLPVGDYTFEVLAVDRDLVYSEQPATVQLSIHPPYGILVLAGGLGLALLALTLVSGYAIRKRRDLFREMQEELQTAHDMQMGLMPKRSPDVKGFDIAGRCITANHVGGDFFQYFEQDSQLSICVADVTGHAMDAAIPVVMFSGVLDSQMELGGTIENLFVRLNNSMCRNLGRRTFICFTMGELGLSSNTLRLSNGGCPSTYHFHAQTGEITELEVGAYPLGIRPNTEYEVLETQLQPGDRIVFCSDGIVEADNAAGEQLGFERTSETIRQACAEGLSAEATIDRILEEVAAFKGNAVQSDDMTCVVVRVEDTEA